MIKKAVLYIVQRVSVNLFMLLMWRAEYLSNFCVNIPLFEVDMGCGSFTTFWKGD